MGVNVVCYRLKRVKGIATFAEGSTFVQNGSTTYLQRQPPVGGTAAKAGG